MSCSMWIYTSSSKILILIMAPTLQEGECLLSGALKMISVMKRLTSSFFILGMDLGLYALILEMMRCSVYITMTYM